MAIELVVAGYLFYDEKLLLIKHRKLQLWLPVGGHIEGGETPDDALIREFREEVGLEVELLNVVRIADQGNILRQLAVPFYVNVHSVGDHEHCCLFYLCKLKSNHDVRLNKGEVEAYKWFSADELYNEEITPDVRNIALLALERHSELGK